jgi:hypothetical protein
MRGIDDAWARETTGVSLDVVAAGSAGTGIAVLRDSERATASVFCAGDITDEGVSRVASTSWNGSVRGQLTIAAA